MATESSPAQLGVLLGWEHRDRSHAYLLTGWTLVQQLLAVPGTASMGWVTRANPDPPGTRVPIEGCKPIPLQTLGYYRCFDPESSGRKSYVS